VKLSRVEWSDDVARGLRDTFIDYTPEQIADAVRANHITIVRADNGSYGAIGQRDGIMLAWSYQGRDSIGFFYELRRLCLLNGLRAIHFTTLHKGLQRLLRVHSPRLIAEESGVKTYEVIP
jgi:hypothetical protein